MAPISAGLNVITFGRTTGPRGGEIKESAIASRTSLVDISFQSLNKGKAIIINYFYYYFIVNGGEPVGGVLLARIQAREQGKEGNLLLMVSCKRSQEQRAPQRIRNSRQQALEAPGLLDPSLPWAVFCSMGRGLFLVYR